MTVSSKGEQTVLVSGLTAGNRELDVRLDSGGDCKGAKARLRFVRLCKRVDKRTV